MHKSEVLRPRGLAPYKIILALAVALALLTVASLRADNADARWGWCYGDPKYTINTPDGDSGQLWVEVEFPIENLEDVTAIEVTIYVPVGSTAAVDPASLGLFVDGQLVEDVSVTGNVEYVDAKLNGNGPVKVEVSATVHATEDFPVRLKITRSVENGELVVTWKNGESDEEIEKKVSVAVQ
ncbi:MAG: hypothetical protein WEB00_05465 [Dehalococcoidia bacterium]